ncbi:MAG: hypothetical protein ABR512_16095, partial [Desulfopila sp.]
RNDDISSLHPASLPVTARSGATRQSRDFGSGLVLFSGLPRSARNDGGYAPLAMTTFLLCTLPRYPSLRGAERRGSPGFWFKAVVVSWIAALRSSQ